MLGVLFFVSFLFFFLLQNSFFFKRLDSEYQWGELFCRVIPVFVLFLQVVPSLGLLYIYGLMSLDSSVSLKVVGHQWYWSYDLGDVFFVNFDSFIKPVDVLVLGDFRQLEVDNRCVLPCFLDVRFCVSSADVLHAWSLNGLSIKLDAMGGVISVFCYNFPSSGVFYGQCSEICGANHSFIPIVLEVSPFSLFKDWCLSFSF